MDRLRRLGRLPRTERAVLVEAWLTFLIADIALRTVSFERLLAFYARPPRRPRRPLPPVRLGWLVDVAARHLPVPVGCLERALVLASVLRRRGIPATMLIGVVRDGAGVAAHAWVEHDGAAAPGGADGHFTPLLSVAVGAAP